MKERRKQVNGRSRHRVISCKNYLIVATSVSVSRWIKKRIASKELKLLRISFSQTNKNESLLSVDKRKKKRKRRKCGEKNGEKWKRERGMLDERYLTLSGDQSYVVQMIPRSICRDPSNYPSSPSIPGSRLMILGTRGGLQDFRSFLPLFARRMSSSGAGS